MRKQTKLVAVLSTAALLAIGASMTSFAATGWQKRMEPGFITTATRREQPRSGKNPETTGSGWMITARWL